MAVPRSLRPRFLVSRTSPAPGHGGAVPSARVTPPNTQVVRFAVGLRGRYLFATDLIGIVLASYLALALRFDHLSGPFSVPAFPVVVGLLLTVRTIINVQLGLYSRRWRFASVPDLERIVGAVAQIGRASCRERV